MENNPCSGLAIEIYENSCVKAMLQMDKYPGLSGINPAAFGIRHRLNQLARFKYEIVQYRAHMIATIFQVSRGPETVIYAVVYSIYNPEKGGLKHLFIALGPTYKSMDSEYRETFFPYKNFRNKIDIINDQIDVPKHIINLLDSGVYKIMDPVMHISDKIRSIMLSNGHNPDHIVATNINLFSTMSMILFSAAWITNYTAFKTLTHVDPGFHNIFYSISINIPEQQLLYKKMFVKNLLQTGMIRPKPINYTKSGLGIKMMSVNQSDLTRVNDIGYKVWREIHINKAINKLIVNLISDMVPMFHDWFYLDYNDPMFWCNEVNRIKLMNSKIAEQIIDDLERTRRSTYIKTRTMDEMFISYSFENMSNVIKAGVNYAERELVISNKILCYTLEHVGTTFGDMIENFANIYENGDIRKRTLNIIQNTEVMSGTLFCCFYNLLCMNEKTGIIHADLHLNNLIRNTQNYHDDVSGTSKIIIINDDIYITPRDMDEFPFIIDYSRSLLLPRFIPQADYLNVIAAQNSELIRLFAADAGEIYDVFIDTIDYALYNNPGCVYDIFKFIDAYRLCKSFASGIEFLIGLKYPEVPVNGINIRYIRENVLPLIYSIQDYIKKWANTQLTNLSKDKDYVVNSNINLLIINEYFRSLLFESYTHTKEQNYVGVCNFNNKMTHDLDSYESYPEMMRFDYLLKHGCVDKSVYLKEIYENHERIEKINTPETDAGVIRELTNEIRDYKEKKKKQAIAAIPDNTEADIALANKSIENRL